MPRKGLQELLGRDPVYRGSFGQENRNATAPNAGAADVLPKPVGSAEEGRPLHDPGPAGRIEHPSRPEGAIRSDRVVVAVNTRPLAAQVERMHATGLPVRDLMKAAWRQATTGLILEATYVDPPLVEVATGSAYRFSTTWTVAAATVAALAHEHDPLGVRGSWALIRGQVEPALWTALDDVLARMAERRHASKRCS